MRIARLSIAVAFAGIILMAVPSHAQDEEEAVPIARRLLSYNMPSRLVDKLYERAELVTEAKVHEHELEYFATLFEDTEKRRYERKAEKADEEIIELKQEIRELEAEIKEDVERATKDYARDLDRITDRIIRMEEQAVDAPERTREKVFKKADELRVKQEFLQEVIRTVSGTADFGTEFGERLRPAPAVSPRARKWTKVPQFTVPIAGQDGKFYDVKDRKGILVLVFWTTVNDDSLRALRDVDQLIRKYDDRQDIEFVSINVNDSLAEIADGLGRAGARLEIVLGLNGGRQAERTPTVEGKTAAELFNVKLVPAVVVVNYDGIVEQTLVGYDTGLGSLLDDMIEVIVERRQEDEKRKEEK